MDANKRAKLKEIGYRILNTCGSCVSFRTNAVMGSGFGSCTRFEYEHLKQGWKDLSVHRSGTCPRFQAKATLEGFEEFRDGLAESGSSRDEKYPARNWYPADGRA